MKRLPEAVLRLARQLFWDIEPGELDLERHEDFIFGRVLSLGDLDAVSALRAEVGDDALRAFIQRAPHRLDRRSLRFFQVLLSLPEASCTTTPSPRISAPLFRP